MTVNYLPGRPESCEGSVSFVNWHSLTILAYCSGNNLIILTKNFESLQTIPLESDSRCCDINKHNGKIAVTVGLKVLVYRPVIENYSDYTFYTNKKNSNILNIHWELELVITNRLDDTSINCINWSDSCDSFTGDEDDDDLIDSDSDGSGIQSQDEFNTDTSGELIIGSMKSLTLWRLYYKNKKSHTEMKLTSRVLWYKIQPGPVFMAKLSPDSTLIASCGRNDNFVKIWKRLTFGIESAEFDLSYLKHVGFVTGFRWRKKISTKQLTQSRAASPSFINGTDSASLNSTTALLKNINILYTFSTDHTVRIFTSFEADNKNVTQFNGSLDLKLLCNEMNSPIFLNIIDNNLVDFAIQLAISDLHSFDNLSSKSLEQSSLKTPKTRHRSDSAVSLSQQREIELLLLLQKKIDICLVTDSKGQVQFYIIENLSQHPPKFLKLTKLKTRHPILLSPNSFPKAPRFLAFQDFLITKYYDEEHDSLDYTLSLVFNDLEKGSIRHVEFLFSSILDCLLELGKEENELKVPKHLEDEDSSFFLVNEDSSAQSFHHTIGSLQHKYSGHGKSIRKLRRSFDGSALLSLTNFGESHLWTPGALGNPERLHKHHLYLKKHQKHLHYFNGTGVTLSRKSLINTSEKVLDAIVFNGAEFVLTLLKEELVLWDCRNDANTSKIAKRICSAGLVDYGQPLAFFLLPERREGLYHLVAIYSKTNLKSWKITIDVSESIWNISDFGISEFPTEQEDIHLISPVDPVGWDTKLGDNDLIPYKYDVKFFQQRDILSIIDREGNLRIYSAMLAEDESLVRWYLKSHTKTDIKDAASIKGSSINKCAIVDSEHQTLRIWDTKTQFMEFEDSLNEKIIDLDWTCAYTNDVSILAVGFEAHILLYTQLRYDYTNETPAYAPIRSIEFSDMTSHPLGDSTWLMDGTLVIGAGNQFYVADKFLDINKDNLSQRILGSTQIVYNDIFTLGRVVNGTLPLYHPQFLIQSLFLEKYDDVKKILVELYRNIREIELDPNGDIWKDILPSLSLNFEDFVSVFVTTGPLASGSSSERETSKEQYKALFSNGASNDVINFDKQLTESLIEKLQKVKIPFLTNHQQITLVSVVEILQDIDSNYKSVLDMNGLRYYLGLKLYQLNALKIGFNGSISMRDVSFALHSENKDLLFNIVNDISHSELTWSVAKNYGLVYWLSNEKLTEQFEKIARNEFLHYSEKNGGKKDPSVCSIFYFALKKKQIIIGLWKMAVGHPEQQKMLKFLSNDFKEERWKTSAMKNAFALLSKHRYMDAANFFLLGDSLKDCVNVIIKQLKDVELAIGVVRCYENRDNGPIFQMVLQNYLLPTAVDINDRWTMSYVYHELKEIKKSIQCLIDDDFSDLVVVDLRITPQTRSFLEYDPVLIVLYQFLRKSGISSTNEYQFLTKIVKIYNRMGCDLLSIYISRNWNFNYGQFDTVLSKISAATNVKEDFSTLSAVSSNPIMDDLTLGNGEASKKKFIEPPTSLDFNMDAFDF